MLIRQDDYPIHQTPEPLAHSYTADKNFYDRFFFNGYDADGEIFFAAALGLYPNRRVMDAAFNVLHDGRQYVLNASRFFLGERELTCGPITVVVEEPMRRLRVVVDARDRGLRADLAFEARSAPIEEPRFTHRVDHQVLMDCTRLTQFGSWRGTIELEGRGHAISADRHLGCRDRSWGVRGVGPREPGAPTGEPQFFWLWAPVNFDDVCTHFDVNEDGTGRPWHRNGVIANTQPTDTVEPTETSKIEAVRDVAHAIDWSPGTRRAQRATLRLEPFASEPLELDFEPLCTFQMYGLGYLNPEWGHGLWKGQAAEGYEVIEPAKVDPLDPRFIHIQQVCRVTMGERVGTGVLEQLVLGRHEPSGFRELFDGAG